LHAKSRDLTTTFDLIGLEDSTTEKLKALLRHLDCFMPSMEEADYLSGLTNLSDMAQFLWIWELPPVHSNGASRANSLKHPTPNFECTHSKWMYRIPQAVVIAIAGALVASGLGSDAGVVDLESTLAFMGTTNIIA